jgi:hypothetical protein
LLVTERFDIGGCEEEHVVSAVCVCVGGGAFRAFVLIGISVFEKEEATQRCNNNYACSLELYNILILVNIIMYRP